MSRHGHALSSVAATLALSDWERRTAGRGPAETGEALDDAEWCAAMGIPEETTEEEMAR